MRLLLLISMIAFSLSACADTIKFSYIRSCAIIGQDKALIEVTRDGETYLAVKMGGESAYYAMRLHPKANIDEVCPRATQR